MANPTLDKPKPAARKAKAAAPAATAAPARKPAAPGATKGALRPADDAVASTLANAEDLDCLRSVFLGTSVAARATGAAYRPLLDELRAALDSEEFRALVLKPLLLREPLPVARFAGTPGFKTLYWAQTRLPVDESTRVRCGLVRTWPALLEVLLADAGVAALGSDLVSAGIDRVLRDRIALDPQLQAKHALVGAIDSASGYEVRGWAVDLCHNGTPVMLEFYADNVFIGATRCDEPRPDVADVVGGQGQCGFGFRIASAHRASFGRGAHLKVVDAASKQPLGAGVVVHADTHEQADGLIHLRRELSQLRAALERIEAQLPDVGRVSSLPMEAYEDYWERFYRATPEVWAAQRRTAAAFEFRPLVSIVVPAYKSDARLLERAIASVLRQSYDHWELIVSDDASPDRSELEIVRRRHPDEPRIQWLLAPKNGGIAENTNRACRQAKGEYVAFLDHDDELSPDALFCMVAALQGRRFGLLYSDEDRIEDDDFGRCRHHTPFFKPDFDPDLLLAMNYICHFVVIERQLLQAIDGLRPGYEGAQDHDMLLRASARLKPEDIAHVPRILYHWRVTPGSVSRTPEAEEPLRRRIVALVDDHLRLRGDDAVVEPHADPLGSARLFANRVRWRLPAKAPTVSIVIPTRDRLDLLEPCIDSVLKSAPQYPGKLDLIIVDNGSVEAETKAYFQRIAKVRGVRVMPYDGAFNWSAINNAAARQAQGEVLIFLNNDTVVLTPDWCTEIVSNALRPEVGVVGPRLLYRDGTIQHAGVLIGVEGVAGHEAIGDAPTGGGYFGRTHVLRSTSAVTGACLAVRRKLFLELGGGFDELQLKVAFNDIDFCMRVREAGYRVVYTPFAVLYHFESKSRGRETTPAQQARLRSEGLAFRERWGDKVRRDPYYNLHFERFSRPFSRLQPPPEPAVVGLG